MAQDRQGLALDAGRDRLQRYFRRRTPRPVPLRPRLEPSGDAACRILSRLADRSALRPAPAADAGSDLRTGDLSRTHRRRDGSGRLERGFRPEYGRCLPHPHPARHPRRNGDHAPAHGIPRRGRAALSSPAAQRRQRGYLHRRRRRARPGILAAGIHLSRLPLRRGDGLSRPAPAGRHRGAEPLHRCFLRRLLHLRRAASQHDLQMQPSG